MALMETDFDAYLEKMDSEFDAETAQLERDLERNEFFIEFWDLEYFPRIGEDHNALFSDLLTDIFANQDVEDSEIIVVDAVVAHSRHTMEIENDNPASIQVFREGFLFKDAAAALLFRAGIQ